MPSMNVHPQAKRGLRHHARLLLPTLAFAALAFGCADDSQAASSDDAVAADVTAQTDTFLPQEVSEEAPFGRASDGTPWPEKCDAVYKVTVDNAGKGAKQNIPAGAE